MKNLKAVISISFLLLFFHPGVMAKMQNNDPVLIQINDRSVTLSEFESAYRKNNLNMQVADPKSVEEYLELYINFNLKVLEAINLGMDTNTVFQRELAGYREQLAKPYLTDQEVTDHLLQEAFERMQFDIRASHILVNVGQHSSPEDTLAAWERISSIRDRIINGEPFEKVAREESDDPSARDQASTATRPAMRGNGGDLGYFTVLDMVYPFETAAYNTLVGEVSAPVRTSFGYHIIQVTDRLPAMGRAHVAHIMTIFPPGSDTDTQEEARQRSQEIYEKIQAGEDFGELAAQFSDDRSSGRRNGEMPPFTSNRMVPEFIKAIHNLNSAGQISEPIRTQYGWHIIKLIEKTPPGSFEDVALELKNRISRDSRSELSQEVVIERLKDEYHFQEDHQALEGVIKVVDETIFERKWDPTKANGLNDDLFSFAGQNYTQQDFAQYLEQSQGMRTPEAIGTYVGAMYNNFVNEQILAFEDSRLEEKYPEFKAIMKEYHDGILLFELTDKLVWTKAVEDSLGLQKFLEEHQEDYIWPDRLDATIYTFPDQRIAKRARREIVRAERKGLDYTQVLEKINPESSLDVTARKGIFLQEEEELIGLTHWEPGVGKLFEWKGQFVIVHVHDVIPSQPKKLEEIRGILIADYQNFLEKQWVESLRRKYDIVVNRELLEELEF
ncbi:MAG: peptidylprolyl isomerase [Bacteroides sp.]|jgi:peptidyl-prolyl cis-trans isomerase SurA|nr:peptidylprolyl isomerase [Bacteroides sp.]